MSNNNDSKKLKKDKLEDDFLPPNLKNDRDITKQENKFDTSRITSFTAEKLKNFGRDELIKLLVLADKKSIEQDNLIFEMRTLLQSGKGLGDILNLNMLLATFMSVVRERYNTNNSTVLLIDDSIPNKPKFKIRGYHGLPSTYWNGKYEEELALFNFPVEDGLFWQILLQGQAFSVQNYRGIPRFKVAWEKYNLRILMSDVWCPLIKKGEVKGILTLGLKKDNTQIQESELPFLQNLASIATTNIDSVLKYEKNEIILRNVRTLYDVNQQLADVNDFKKLCIKSLASSVKALKAQKGNLMLLNETTNELEIKVVWGDIPAEVRDRINSGEMKTKTFKIGEGVAGLCAQLRKAIRENNRSNIEQVGKNIVHSMLTVPLIRGEKLVGVINMTNKIKIIDGKNILDPLGKFTEDDETLLLGLADQAAGNLHKSKLYSASITDKLTGLYNKRQFDLELGEYIEKCIYDKSELSLAIIDVDHFKKFNDTYGHKAGDLVLVQVAKKLHDISIKNNSLAFRYGGEELCVILPKVNKQEAYNIMEEFRKIIASLELESENKKMQVTISIGIATSPEDSQDSKLLFNNADSALYLSKNSGRNKTTIYKNKK
jgi:diguanylate cyclase (GGDEF)-like protein